MSIRRMLLVSHEATLTGAPMNLLHFAGWLRTNTNVDLHVLLLKGGDLRHRFEQVCDVTVLDESPITQALGLAQHALVRMGSRRAWRPVAAARLRPQTRHLVGFDVTYLNSVTSVGALPYLPPARLVVNHVHELHVALRTWQPSTDYEMFATRPDRWIAASDSVRTMLVDEVGAPPDRVLLHHEFIDVAPFAGPPDLRAIERCRRAIRIPADAAVVMGGGTIDWRKGPDLFIQLATEVRRRTREAVHFVWVGGDLTGIDMQRLRSDMERTGTDHVHFVGVKPDPRSWYAAADVFALTSREDPYPLVCLEHAVMGHPIVTYRNGGIVELLDAAGTEAATGIVDHLDVGAMAGRIIDFLGSTELRRSAGRQLRERVLSEHSVDVAAPRLLAALERALEEGPRPSPGPA